ncbi:MAG: Wzz/FepE/Etk N-terminal domain-containing protein [Bacillota bacterium]|nr:Wzz/FepE/Etk N-terminal domain-containing protein [Bacillota bacterium]
MIRDKEIDLVQLLQIIWSNIILVAVITVLSGAAGFAITYFFIPPEYTARVSMYVFNKQTPQEATISDIDMSVKLVGTYIVILKSDTVLSEVASESGLNYTAEQLRKMITASSVNNTEVFQVNIVSKNPKDAYILADTIAKVAPKEIIRVVKAGSVEIIDKSEKDPPKTGPAFLKITIIGAFLGFVLSVGIIFIAQMLDKTVKDEKDLADYFGLPVLGAVPNMKKSKSEAYRYGRYS